LSWFRPRAATLQCKFDLAQGESAGFLPAHSLQRVLIVQRKKALDLWVQSKLTTFFYDPTIAFGSANATVYWAP
jgi:hypothetical protein